MPKIYHSAEQLIGNTPLMELCHFEQHYHLSARILAKLECFNPGGSVKDRVALAMLNDAEQHGILKPGGVIIEPTSGNTGIGLAAVAVPRGYRVIIVMPDTMSLERQKLMIGCGAELVLTPGTEGMSGAVQKANDLSASIPGSFVPGQFDNPANAAAHYRTTGPEIWSDTNGHIDVFVAGIGTGGTITGTGRFLREQNPDVKIIGVEPSRSPLLSQGKAGPHGLQGIGANFVPAALDTSIYDKIILVDEQDAYRAARNLGRMEGLLVGISSGAAIHAATELAQQPEYTGKTIVVLLADTGERYLTTPLFDSDTPLF